MPFTDHAPTIEKLRPTQKNNATRVASSATHTTLPTWERESKAGSGMAEVVLREPTGRYVSTKRERSPLEAHEKSFTEDELYVAAQFIRDAEMATSCNITAAYDGAPRQVSGPRSGGVPDKRREAHVRFMNIWRELEPGFQYVAKWLVLEVRRENTGSTVSVAEIGTQVTGLRGQDASRGVGVGLMKGTLWRLAELYRKEMRR